MSVSHQSSISRHYFYKRKDGEEGKRGRYNSSTSAPRGWLVIGHHFINDRVAYSEKNPEYNFFWHTYTHNDCNYVKKKKIKEGNNPKY